MILNGNPHFNFKSKFEDLVGVASKDFFLKLALPKINE
jgi:hypothetical protein